MTPAALPHPKLLTSRKWNKTGPGGRGELLEKQPSPAAEASWARGGNEPACSRQLGCGLRESLAARSLGGGLGGQGLMAGVSTSPSQGWRHLGYPEPESGPLEAGWKGRASHNFMDPLASQHPTDGVYWKLQ